LNDPDFHDLNPSEWCERRESNLIRLPHVEIFSTRLDHAKPRAYSRDTGIFSSADPNLETQVRQEGERQLWETALQDGILKDADQNVRNTISRLLQGLGFSQTIIN
jgi:hypothetical protein